MNAADTNILFYAKDPRDAEKQQTAREVIDSLQNGVLFWQVACEFVAASRKLEPFGYNRQTALTDLRFLRSIWRTILPEWAILDRAEILMNNYSLSFWNEALIAACLENGVTTLYTEDIGDFFQKEGFRVINPF